MQPGVIPRALRVAVFQLQPYVAKAERGRLSGLILGACTYSLAA